MSKILSTEDLEFMIQNYIQKKYNEKIPVHILDWEDGCISINIDNSKISDKNVELLELSKSLGMDDENTNALMKEVFGAENITWKNFYNSKEDKVYIEINQF